MALRPSLARGRERDGVAVPALVPPGLDPAAAPLRELAGERQREAEADAAHLALRGERLEDRGEDVGGDARPLVVDRDLDAAAAAPGADPDGRGADAGGAAH